MIPAWDKFTRPVLFWIFALAALISVPVFRLWAWAAGPGRRQRRYPDRLRHQILEKIRKSPSPSSPTPSDSLPFISIVVPVYNAEATLEFCLESLARQSWPAARREIIVVDNLSTDRSRQIAEKYDVKIVECAFRGPAAARNTGVEAAHGEWVAFMDSDCIAGPRWLERLAVAGMQKRDADDSMVMIGGEIHGLYFGNQAMRRFGREAGLLDQKSAVSGGMLGLPFVITANALVWRQEFLRQGGFDPGLGPAEDSEFGWRLHFANLRIAYEPEARVWHFHRLDAIALHGQYFRYGFNEVLGALKWRDDLEPIVYAQIAWFRPYEYRLFWKRWAELMLALLMLSPANFMFCFYFNTAAMAHFAGQLWAHLKRRDAAGFTLFPEELMDHESEN